MKRPFILSPSNFDCGCIQSDGVTVDIPATLHTYRAIAERNRSKLADEVSWCRGNGIDGIVSDITPFAFDVARVTGIPSVAVTNFTWYDIYREYLTEIPDFHPTLEEIREQYASADLLCSLTPALPMEYFHKKRIVPPVGRKGVNKREMIGKKYCIDTYKKIGLIYLGDFGLTGADWSMLEKFKEWEFFGLQDIISQPSNYHRIDKNTISYQDWIASADCVLSKLGYGVVAESMINGTPVIYLPRRHFSEYPFLEQAVIQWGGGIRLSPEEYCSLSWNDALRSCMHIDRTSLAVSSGGASIAASYVELLISSA